MTASQTADSIPASRTGSRVVLVFGLFVLMTFGTLMGLRTMLRTELKPFPLLGMVPDVALTESTGDQLPLSALRGRTVILMLQPASCDEHCQKRLREMAELQRFNYPVRDKVFEVTVVENSPSLDALNQNMRQAAAHEGWRWFTAEPAAYAQLKEFLALDAEYGFALIDAQGQLRKRAVIHDSEERREVLLDVRRLNQNLPTS